MEEIANAVAILLEEIEDHAAEIKDPLLARRIDGLRAVLESLQLHFDSVTDADGASDARGRPSQARSSAGGTDPLKPGVLRPLPKPE